MKFKLPKYFYWLCIGLLIRLALMPFTVHPDLWGHSFVAYFFAYKHIFNIYDYLLSLPANHPLVTNFGVADIFIYPPLTYFTFGAFRLIVKPFIDPNFIPWLMENVSYFYLHNQINQIIFLFKLPYLFLDVFMAYVFSNLFEKEKNKKLAFVLWMFNPVAIYVSFMVGQFDLIPVFFVILSLFFVKKQKYWYSMLMLGIGGSYKIFPLLFIPVAAFLFSKNLFLRLKYILVGLFPFIVSISPFIFSSAFRYMAFSPKSQKMLFLSFNISGAEVLYPFIVLLFLVYLYYFYFFANNQKNILSKLMNSYLVILLLIFSITHYHPQWFLWITPFLIYFYIKNKEYWLLILGFFVIWIFITLMFEASLSYGLFSPLYPNLQNAKSLSFYLSKYFEVNQITSIVRSIFASMAIYIVAIIYKEKTNE